MILSGIGSLIGIAANFVGGVGGFFKGLLGNLGNIGAGLAGAGAAIYAGKSAIDSFHHFQKGEYAEGAKEGLKAATTGVGALLGGMLAGPKGAAWGAAAAGALSEAADAVGKKIGNGIMDIAETAYDVFHPGEKAQTQAQLLVTKKQTKDYLNTVTGGDEDLKAYAAKKMEFDLSSSKEQGVFWGKNEDEVEKRRKEKYYLARKVVMKERPKVAKVLDSSWASGQISEEWYQNRYIQIVDEIFAEKKQLNLAKQRQQTPTDTVNNESLETNSTQTSEENLRAKQQQQTSDENTQKIQESVTNATQHSNNSVNQVNITEVNEKGVYDSGDAARTMLTV